MTIDELASNLEYTVKDVIEKNLYKIPNTDMYITIDDNWLIKHVIKE